MKRSARPANGNYTAAQYREYQRGWEKGYQTAKTHGKVEDADYVGRKPFVCGFRDGLDHGRAFYKRAIAG